MTGAAISMVLTRFVLVAAAWHSAVVRHGLVGSVEARRFFPDVRTMLVVSLPAILTNLATPVGSAWVMRSMAVFGAAAVAGQATIDRIAPVAFALLFALSGAIGPILAQNLGAGRPDRVRAALWDAVIFTILTVLASWAFLGLAQDAVLWAFSAHGVTAGLVRLYCTWLAGSFVFAALLFVANAAFNNLGHPLLSTAFNWGRATLGTIPFVTIGAEWGPRGVLIGQALGAVAFGVAAIAVAFRVLPRAKVATSEHHVQAHHSLTGISVLAMLLERRPRSPAG